MKRILSLVILIWAASLLWGQSAMQEVDSGSMTVSWQVRGESLYIRISAPTAGWVAVGFEPSRMMKDADIYIGYVASDGTAVLEDHFADKLTGHQADTALGGRSDVSRVSGTEQGGVTTLEFLRPLNSGDSRDKALVPGQEYTMITAFGTRDNLTSVHRERGSVRIKL